MPLHRTLVLTITATALAHGAARADTAVGAAPDQRGCAVDVVTAPDDVREEIGRWIATEPRCGRPLTVRAVTAADGIYLLAQDDRGRTYERVVPDSGAAGVLVASWAAAIDETPAAQAGAGPTAPAGAAPPAEAAGGAAAVTTPWRGRWLAAGIEADEDRGYALALRGHVELARRGRWSFGARADFTGYPSLPTLGPSGEMRSDSGIAIGLAAEAAWTLRWEAWRLRASLAVGPVYAWTSFEGAASGQGLDQIGASAEVARQLGGRWIGFLQAQSLTARDGIGTAIHDATNFSEDTHRLGALAGVAIGL